MPTNPPRRPRVECPETDLVRHWDDISFSAWAHFDPDYPDTHVNFCVYEICGTDVREGDKLPYARGYQREGADVWPDPVESRLDAEVFLSGAVKWDGCSNWDFHEDGMHFCDVDEAKAIGTLFERLYAWAKELGMDRLD